MLLVASVFSVKEMYSPEGGINNRMCTCLALVPEWTDKIKLDTDSYSAISF